MHNRTGCLLALLAGSGAALSCCADPIHEAVKANDAARVRTIAQSAPNAVNARSADGLTPLHVAAASGASAGAEALLAAGADPNVLARDGQSSLQMAVASNAVSVVALLIETTDLAYAGAESAGSLARLGPADAGKAGSILTQLLREKPESAKINFALGRACLAVREYGRAQLAFERVLRLDPGNDRARLELARALLAGGQHGLARAAFAEVLARKPPESVERAVRAQLDLMDRHAREWRGTAQVGAGWLCDDNVNLGPSADTIEIAPLRMGAQPLERLTVREDSRPERAQGVFASLAGSATRDIGDTGGWMLVADARVYQNRLDRSAQDFESFLGQGGAGLQRTDRGSMALCSFDAAHLQYGGSPFLDAYGVHGAYARTVRAARNVTLVTPVSCDYRDYRELDDRDGLHASVGETLRCALAAGHTLAAGIAVFHAAADADAFAHTGVIGSVGLENEVARWLRAHFQLRYTFTDYEARETLAPRRRADDEWRVAAGLSGAWAERFGYEAGHEWTHNESTFDLYAYERNVTTVGVWVRF